MAIRFYSSSSLDLVDVTIKVIRKKKRKSLYGNKNPIESNIVVDEYTTPILKHHKPFAKLVLLSENDVDIQQKQLVAFQGNELQSSEMELTILITGYVPQIGVDFAQTHTYIIPIDIQWGKYQTLDDSADYQQGTKSTEWNGWGNWEGIEAEFEDTLPVT